MGRVIDADKFKGKVIASHTGSGVIKLIAIDEVPTAYDLDKVVEQLEKAKEKDTEIALDEAQKERCFWYAQGMNRAIEIVKGGGADATD